MLYNVVLFEQVTGAYVVAWGLPLRKAERKLDNYLAELEKAEDTGQSCDFTDAWLECSGAGQRTLREYGAFPR